MKRRLPICSIQEGNADSNGASSLSTRLCDTQAARRHRLRAGSGGLSVCSPSGGPQRFLYNRQGHVLRHARTRSSRFIMLVSVRPIHCPQLRALAPNDGDCVRGARCDSVHNGAHVDGISKKRRRCVVGHRRTLGTSDRSYKWSTYCSQW